MPSLRSAGYNVAPRDRPGVGKHARQRPADPSTGSIVRRARRSRIRCHTQSEYVIAGRDYAEARGAAPQPN